MSLWVEVPMADMSAGPATSEKEILLANPPGLRLGPRTQARPAARGGERYVAAQTPTGTRISPPSGRPIRHQCHKGQWSPPFIDARPWFRTKTAHQRPMGRPIAATEWHRIPANPLKKKAPGYSPGAKSNREASRLGDVGSEDPNPRHCTWERGGGEPPELVTCCNAASSDY